MDGLKSIAEVFQSPLHADRDVLKCLILISFHSYKQQSLCPSPHLPLYPPHLLPSYPTTTTTITVQELVGHQ